jgi:hypothetical protein
VPADDHYAGYEHVASHDHITGQSRSNEWWGGNRRSLQYWRKHRNHYREPWQAAIIYQ